MANEIVQPPAAGCGLVIPFSINPKARMGRPPALSDLELLEIRQMLFEHKAICVACPAAIRILSDTELGGGQV